MRDPSCAPAPTDQANTALTNELLRMIAGGWITQAIYVAAKLGIADLLEEQPKSNAQLAEATGADEESLYRVLRALASLNIFAETADGRFGLTPLAACLRTSVAGTLRFFAIMQGEQWVWRSWGETMHSVRTGQPAFDHVFGAPVFKFYSVNQVAARVSADGLTSRSGPENAAVAAAYDFSDARTIVDVGGGQGTLLSAILAANPQARGILLEMPHVIDMAKPMLEQSCLAGRYELVSGDFFSAVPGGGDVYLLKKVIHDWDDNRAQAILDSCRKAIPPSGRLLLVEAVVPPGNEPSFAKLIDLLMLVYAGGRERTEAEHQALLKSAGFGLRRVIPTASTLSIIEAIPI